MIFLAYNYYKYKLNNTKNIEWKKFVIETINKHFPNEDYLLPYSHYSRLELEKILNDGNLKITGKFKNDLPLMMLKCNKLAFFPTESLFIGSGVFIEILEANRKKIPVYCYNKITNKFTTNFILKNSEFLYDLHLSQIFFKKVDIL